MTANRPGVEKAVTFSHAQRLSLSEGGRLSSTLGNKIRSCAFKGKEYHQDMTTLNEIEASAMTLPDQQRAELASHLLNSLPAVLQDDDQGLAEALRRDSELEADPSMGMTLNEFKSAIEL